MVFDDLQSHVTGSTRAIQLQFVQVSQVGADCAV